MYTNYSNNRYKEKKREKKLKNFTCFKKVEEVHTILHCFYHVYPPMAHQHPFKITQHTMTLSYVLDYVYLHKISQDISDAKLDFLS